MTQDEFDAQIWRSGLKGVYGKNLYIVAGCNFKERLISLEDDNGDQFWVRCENVQIVGAAELKAAQKRIGELEAEIKSLKPRIVEITEPDDRPWLKQTITIQKE